jgi:hypothetical protein
VVLGIVSIMDSNRNYIHGIAGLDGIGGVNNPHEKVII